MKKICLLIIFLINFTQLDAQFGIGLTGSYDFYQFFQNPDDDLEESRSSGSALLNFGLGPKLWVGMGNFSLSFESQASIGLLGLSVGDYKGLGVASIPILAKLNFGGLSGVTREGNVGWTIGAGIQYNHTEIYYLKDSFQDKGGTRKWYRTTVVHIGYGLGMTGFAGQVYIRTGYNNDMKAWSGNIGIQLDFNFIKLKEVADPNSEL